MKHESCKTCRFYWEPDCHRYYIPIRVYAPEDNYCEEHTPNDKEVEDESLD